LNNLLLVFECKQISEVVLFLVRVITTDPDIKMCYYVKKTMLKRVKFWCTETMFGGSAFSHYQTSQLTMSRKGASGMSKNALKKKEQMERALKNQQELFRHYYASQFGDSRWSKLEESLKLPAKHVAMVNKYVNQEFARNLLRFDNVNGKAFYAEIFDPLIACISSHDTPTADSVEAGSTVNAVVMREEIADTKTVDILHQPQSISQSVSQSLNKPWPFPNSLSSLCPETGLSVYYPLDAASLFPVRALAVESHHSVLDLCAAPGGKSLAILQYLALQSSSLSSAAQLGSLTSNDASPDRRQRLKQVFRQYTSLYLGIRSDRSCELRCDFSQNRRRSGNESV
jgi:hypothetical protein